MQQILCYGDSNTWGLIPGTKERYNWGVRWTSLLQQKFGSENVRVIEEGLCGRTTKFEDACRENRNGLKSLPLVLETYSPLDAAVIMLGTNDCKSIYRLNAAQIAACLSECVDEIVKFVPADRILIVSPIHLGENVGEEGFDPEFDEISVVTSHQLEEAYRRLAAEKNISMIAASDYAEPSEVDREHMTPNGHAKFAEAVYQALSSIIE